MLFRSKQSNRETVVGKGVHLGDLGLLVIVVEELLRVVKRRGGWK